jgi:hypothetical protein
MSEEQPDFWKPIADPVFVETVRSHVRLRIAPQADAIDRDDIYPLEIIRGLAQTGLSTITLPQEYGGCGDFILVAALFEEVGYASAAVGVSLLTIFQAQTMMRLFGSRAIKDRFMPRFAQGLPASYSLTEATHGSDIRSLDTKAVRDGDDWVLNGEKSFITSGSAAEFFVLLAETELGVSVFAMPYGLEGCEKYVGEYSATMGLRNGPHVNMRIKNVRLLLLAQYTVPCRGHGMRFCFGGGAPKDVWQAIEERFNVVVCEAYGMTELGGWTSANSFADRRIGSAGRVRDDIEVKIVDTLNYEVPRDTKGEIVARPRVPNVILAGYWDKPDKFVEVTRDLWFHSGDQGAIDEDGYLYFFGRLKELIRRGGEMISPVEVETRLMTMPGVADCAIVGVPDPVMEQEVKAVIVTEKVMDPRSVRNWLAQHFPSYMLPRYVAFVDAIPKTETQKVQRNRLTSLDTSVFDLRT